MRDIHKLYIQSCWDCGVTPRAKTYKKLKEKEKEKWSIREVAEYRKAYEEYWYYDLQGNN